MRDVTLLVMSPAILSERHLALTISMDDVVISNFTTGPEATTTPNLLWSKVKLGVTPDINALGTLTVVTVGVIVSTVGRALNRAEKRREMECRRAYRSNE